MKRNCCYFIIASALSMATFVYAEQNVVNNAAPVQSAPQCGGNQNNIYDPRVPPAGVYSTRNSDGSSNTVYTTGEKKPYYVDNYCNQPTSAVQPVVFGGGWGGGPVGPRSGGGGGGHR